MDAAPDDETHSRYARILLSPSAENKDQMIAMANQCLNRIRSVDLQKRYQSLMQQISSLPQDSPDIPAMLMEAQAIRKKLGEIR